jgi:hypothetical protein
MQEQRRQMTMQFEALQTQRQFQKDIAAAEMGRLQTQIASAEAVQLFNTELERRALNQTEIINQSRAAAELFQIQQQELVENTQAAQQREQASAQLQQQGEQVQQGVEQAIAEDQLATRAEARGQGESRSTSAQAQAQAMQLDEAFQRFNQLFEMNTAVANQNQELAGRLSSLQTELGTNEARTRELMNQQDLAIARVVNSNNQQFVAIDSAMNRAAADAELAARLFNIEAAESADQMSYQGAMTTSKMQQQAASGPGLFGALPALAQAGIGIYNAATPLRSPTAQVTNPLYSPGAASNSSLNWSQGVMTDTTNSLFNIA